MFGLSYSIDDVSGYEKTYSPTLHENLGIDYPYCLKKTSVSPNAINLYPDSPSPRVPYQTKKASRVRLLGGRRG